MLDLIKAMDKEKYHNNLGEERVKKGVCISHVDIKPSTKYASMQKVFNSCVVKLI